MSTSPPPGRSDDLTVGGRRLAALYAHALGLVDQITRAVEEGNWPYLADVSGEAVTAFDELSAAASLVTTEAVATVPGDVLALAERLAHPEE
ncbi:hypothetical protein GXW83_18325 [Streptacidiphilus sp. PB12-B1b]|uniref:hypothetical protein n=1 Tax=Streptacidiphilus sp. PB12-B1b TaxID=2705012 RepID=UPI0015FCD658|nr:hypothetical protein [Streptacidiphilus sp. PB12-B1b]QMU77364.1 hypothetical protein GXW83_18325 [Streptacidiphilus sp. PB12-B1b]